MDESRRQKKERSYRQHFNPLLLTLFKPGFGVLPGCRLIKNMDGKNNPKRQDFVFDRLGFDLLCIEAKKRLSRSKFIIFVIGIPFLVIGVILWFLKLFEVVAWWIHWPFILVAFGSSIYNHFNLRRLRKLINKRREILNSYMKGKNNYYVN